jgi:hypothetical protein
METWSRQEVEQLAAARELHIAVKRTDGTLHRWTPIWVVCSDGQVYVRTWYRRDAGWFGQVLRSRRARIRVPGLEADATVEDVGEGTAELRESINTAYRNKYGNSNSASMVGATAAATTLGISPEQTVL